MSHLCKWKVKGKESFECHVSAKPKRMRRFLYTTQLLENTADLKKKKEEPLFGNSKTIQLELGGGKEKKSGSIENCN